MESIKYKSTRGKQSGVSFEEVVLGGLASDGGLFVPERLPQLSLKHINNLRKMSFPDLAIEIISLFVRPDEIPLHDLRQIVNKSFETFRSTEVTPSVRLGDFWVLELFHGPTFAFKDIALQFLGNLFEFFLSRGKVQSSLTILGATSGDTGSAAIHGLRGKANLQVYMLFPHRKITEVQERQMTTVLDANVHCLSVRGDFDDAQALVKAAFADRAFRDEVKLGAINSINWARVLAQVSYFVYCYLRVTDIDTTTSNSTPQGVPPVKVSFAVPTGNFGDMLAGYYAKALGLPIDRLVICNNENDALHRFLLSGTYRRSPAISTIAPSMDISAPSNFERYLFYLAEQSPAVLAAWMDEFADSGELTVPAHLLSKARLDFGSHVARKADIVGAMHALYAKERYLVCPHTATAVVAATALRLPAARTVVLATAHPAKFEDAVALALGQEEVPPRPMELQELFGQPTRVTELPTALLSVQDFIRAANGQQQALSEKHQRSAEHMGWQAAVLLGGGVALAAALVVMRWRK